MPRVTVVIPCYNYGHYLEDAVSSLIAQTFTDWEAIVIDDASTDSTPEVVSQIRDTRVTCIRHETNWGNIRTFNHGLTLAQGDFLVLLSADDRYHPEFMESVVRMLDEHPEAGVVYTGVEVIDGAGKARHTMRSIMRRHHHSGVHDELRLLLMGNSIPNCSGVARREVLNEVGLYNPRFPNAGDWDLWLRIAMRYKMGFIKEPLYQYRLHGGNMSFTRARGHQIEDELAQILSEVLDHPALPSSARSDRHKVLAHLYWSQACWRLQHRDVLTSFKRVRIAMGHDARVVLEPRSIIRLLGSAVLGTLRMTSSSV
jgi:glycosyltransferase involved in cell wall biosynthesis